MNHPVMFSGMPWSWHGSQICTISKYQECNMKATVNSWGSSHCVIQLICIYPLQQMLTSGLITAIILMINVGIIQLQELKSWVSTQSPSPRICIIWSKMALFWCQNAVSIPCCHLITTCSSILDDSIFSVNRFKPYTYQRASVITNWVHCLIVNCSLLGRTSA